MSGWRGGRSAATGSRFWSRSAGRTFGDVRVYQKQEVEHVLHELVWCHECHTSRKVKSVLSLIATKTLWKRRVSLKVARFKVHGLHCLFLQSLVCYSTKFPHMQRAYCLYDNVSAPVQRLNCAWHLAFKIDSAATPCSCSPPNPWINDLMSPLYNLSKGSESQRRYRTTVCKKQHVGSNHLRWTWSIFNAVHIASQSVSKCGHK